MAYSNTLTRQVAILPKDVTVDLDMEVSLQYSHNRLTC